MPTGLERSFNLVYSAGMNSYAQVLSPRAALWVAMCEAEHATGVADRTRHALDAEEAEALATRRAEARRAHRLASEAVRRDVVTARR